MPIHHIIRRLEDQTFRLPVGMARQPYTTIMCHRTLWRPPWPHTWEFLISAIALFWNTVSYGNPLYHTVASKPLTWFIVNPTPFYTPHDIVTPPYLMVASAKTSQSSSSRLNSHSQLHHVLEHHILRWLHHILRWLPHLTLEIICSLVALNYRTLYLTTDSASTFPESKSWTWLTINPTTF